MSNFSIVKLNVEHLSDVAELERLSFAHPWTEEGLMTLVREGGVGFCAVDDESGKVVSYAGMVMAVDMGDITDVATHPDFRRRGLSRQVMIRLLEYARENSITSVALDVRVSNSGAISLYKSLDFEIAGKRPRFYRTPPEDAYVMVKQL